jgi:hypothetical protein
MSDQSVPQWERYIQLAETYLDLDRVSAYVEEAEAAMFSRSLELLPATHGSEESQALRRASARLLRVKNERLKWPNPFLQNHLY